MTLAAIVVNLIRIKDDKTLTLDPFSTGLAWGIFASGAHGLKTDNDGVILEDRIHLGMKFIINLLICEFKDVDF